jgi:very-short-patch-repair endonuclease
MHKKSNSDFVKEVYELTGNEYMPLEAYDGNKIKILFQHALCGHTWKSTPNNFLKGNRCPKCNRPNYYKNTEKFKNEVLALVGSEYLVLGEYVNVRTKISIKHNSCGHTYDIFPNDFLDGEKCPVCRESRGEKTIRKYLEDAGIEFKGQYKIDGCKNKHRLVFDFVMFEAGILKAIIEYDGRQHFYEDYRQGGKTKLEERQRNDDIKNQYCASHGIPLIRISFKTDCIERLLDAHMRQIINKAVG